MLGHLLRIPVGRRLLKSMMLQLQCLPLRQSESLLQQRERKNLMQQWRRRSRRKH